ncbi:MAG TPA: cytochrome c peroxidase, partial [Candidatus Angelobacter sp.]|nr:cytochrome c peroxidase [Candidatus Angelobacter sp.]
MSNKFIRQVLALVCSAALASSSMGLSGPGGGGSGKNGGGGSSSGSGNGGNQGGSGSGGNGGGDNRGGGNQGGGENETGNAGGGNQGGGAAQQIERKLASLKTVPVPGPTAAELNNVVKDKSAAIALGKALFWDMQSGSDGFTACATCHFNAGADSRTMNQIDPGLRRVDASGNAAADSTTFYPGFGPNHQLSFSDFPLHKLSDITRSNSAVMDDNNNIVGSQGQF